ncbi:hypothetical protein [Mycobacterium sp. Root135]|uniref:hypothetical protein n=1 Tax=Mycobacterium sp. Root135 TaxID=1736457 RepID=UPI0012EA6631|nr:hypothetical protein [Mycobacterium sp. Root135]
MQKFTVRIAGVLVALVAAVATFGVGTSAAKDPYIGSTYAQASGKIAERGGNPVISTVVGDQLSTDECIVTSWRKATFAKTDNFDHGKDYLLSINCSAKVAKAGVPGNSLASPEGQKQKSLDEQAAGINRNHTWCEKNLDRCEAFCEKNDGLCSKEVMALF